ncbi:hypothetical protein ACVQ92_04620 [Staphylococcus aureus]
MSLYQTKNLNNFYDKEGFQEIKSLIKEIKGLGLLILE